MTRALLALALVSALLVIQAMPSASAAGGAPGTRVLERAGAKARNPYAGSKLYIGRDPGIRIAIRIRGRKVLLAKALMRLNCVGPEGRHHYSRVKKRFAEAAAPLAIDRNGRFLLRPERVEEPGLVLEEGITGRTSSGLVVGSVLYFANEEYRHLRCQTGSRPRIGVKSTRIKFRARLRSGRHRVRGDRIEALGGALAAYQQNGSLHICSTAGRRLR